MSRKATVRFLLLLVFVTSFGCLTSSDAEVSEDASKTSKLVQELLARLNEQPDLLHYNYTPAVSELIELGEPSIEPTLPYLLSEDAGTRVHADTAIYGAMMKMNGFNHGKGWINSDCEKKFATFYRTLWDKEKTVYDATFVERQIYIERVKDWLISRRL